MYYGSSNYVFPQFVLHWEKKLPNFSNRYHILWYRVSIWLFFLFFLFHGLHYATTLRVLKPVLCFHMTWFNYGAKGVKDVDPACRCHQSNIMPDSIFSVNIAQCVTCLCVFRFVLFYVYIKGWYSGLLLFVETGCSVISLLH